MSNPVSDIEAITQALRDGMLEPPCPAASDQPEYHWRRWRGEEFPQGVWETLEPEEVLMVARNHYQDVLMKLSGVTIEDVR